MDIEVKQVSKTFGKKRVLNHISLTAQSSEILCLLGPSGAGKTTLIRLITGAIKGDEGEISVGGLRVPHWEIVKKMGFMPQEDGVYPDLTGKENLDFFGELYGLKGETLKKRTGEMLALVELTQDKDKRVSKYSGGMKKRLSLAIALIHNPEIIVLDEPTVGIDPVLRKKIWDQFDALTAQGKLVIVSTHVMDEANRCQRAALIYEGQLIALDTVENLLKNTENGHIEEIFFLAEKGGL